MENDLSVVVPTFNERENLPLLLERIHTVLDGVNYEVIVVDDNSPDGTGDLGRDMSDRYPVNVIVRKDQRGLASAVVEGFKRSKSSCVAVIDADLQHPPELLLDLYQALQAADLAVASRYGAGGGVGEWGLLRRVVSKGATLMAQLLLPLARSTPDPLSGYFAVRREAIDGVELDPVGYKILLEILARGRIERVATVPYIFDTRAHGQSKLGLRDQLNYFRHLIRLAKKADQGH